MNNHATPNTPHERLRHARKAAGYKTAIAAAMAMGVNPVTYTAHENGGRSFDNAAASAYATHFHVDPGAIMFGPNESGREEPAAKTSSPPRSGLSVEVEDLLEWPDAFLKIGPRISDENARIVEVVGDYMYDPSDPSATGSLLPGDCVIIDTNDTRIAPPGTFAILEGGRVALKMIETIPNSDPVKVRITGRNSRYQIYERLADEIQIIGRVKAKISML